MKKWAIPMGIVPLFLSEGTVKNYVSTIFVKLEVSDRIQATIFALRNGLAKL